MNREQRIGYGSADFEDEYRGMLQRYPFMTAHQIGKSVMGKPLIALRCGNGEKHLHINAAVHANEWLTSMVLMRFMEEVAEKYQNGGTMDNQSIAELFSSVTLWAVPMVNPDGVDLAQHGVSPKHPFHRELLVWNKGGLQFTDWKANIRGVDLNDQFPAYWEQEVERRAVSGPGPRDYTGTAPLTEPEAEALAQFTQSQPPNAVVSLHSQGKEIYWNYRDYEPPEAKEWAEQLGRASGYEPIKLTGSDAGFKDWFIQEFRRPGFTIELGYGTNPLPLSQADTIYSELRSMLLEMMKIICRK